MKAEALDLVAGLEIRDLGLDPGRMVHSVQLNYRLYSKMKREDSEL